MRIDRAKNTYAVVLTQMEAVNLIAELGAGIKLAGIRYRNRIGRDNVKLETTIIERYSTRDPERIVRIELEDLPIDTEVES